MTAKADAANGDRLDGRILERLYAVVDDRRTADPSVSYTARLLSKGKAKIAKKTGEEAVEVVVAALAQDREDVAAESADLLYHLLVLWVASGVKPREVWAQLAKREGISGLVEKASRGNG